MGSTWRIVATLRDKEVSRTGRGVRELFTTLEQTFGLSQAWLDQTALAVRAVAGDQPDALELTWSFCPEDIWLTPTVSELFGEPASDWFQDDFRMVITLRCE
jgi:hypothetical protein